MQRQVISIGLGAILFLGLIGLGRAPPVPQRALVVSAALAPTWAQRALLLATATPATALRLDVHVEANAQGEGSAHVVASSQGGQALAHIDTKGQAGGWALADAPALPGCNVCGGAGPLADGQKAEDRGRPSAEGTRSEAEATPWSGQAVVVAEVVNLRTGPSLSSGVIGGARAGDRFVVTGRSADQAWWRVCCTADQRHAWLYAALTVLAASPPGLLPAETVTPPLLSSTPTPTPTPAWAFRIVEQEQHSEANYVTVYAWVQDGNGGSLAGYRLLVTQEGLPLSVGVVRSTAYRQGTTRPSVAGGPEDKAYNLKLAFDPSVMGDGFRPAGAWGVQLLDPQGQPVAPLALFALRANDDHMEMYLNYAQR